jgi:transcriptional regulator with GAF, ATPase, and Fis domain
MTAYDPSQHDAVQSLIDEFASIARRVHTSDEFDESLGRITATAQQSVGGCEAASISLIAKDRPVTFGATDTLAFDGDQIQYDEGEGPCMDAALQETWVSTPDLAADPRWPRSAARLSAQLGVRSMFSCRMALDASPRKTLGGLNLYATSPDAFTTKDQMLAILLSSLGAVVIDSARQQEQLRAAIASRQVIGEAVGILRVQSNLTSNQAFEMLSRASQRTNVKLRDLAKQISTGSRAGRNGGFRTDPVEAVPRNVAS